MILNRMTKQYSPRWQVVEPVCVTSVASPTVGHVELRTQSLLIYRLIGGRVEWRDQCQDCLLDAKAMANERTATTRSNNNVRKEGVVKVVHKGGEFGQQGGSTSASGFGQ